MPRSGCDWGQRRAGAQPPGPQAGAQGGRGHRQAQGRRDVAAAPCTRSGFLRRCRCLKGRGFSLVAGSALDIAPEVGRDALGRAQHRRGRAGRLAAAQRGAMRGCRPDGDGVRQRVDVVLVLRSRQFVSPAVKVPPGARAAAGAESRPCHYPAVNFPIQHSLSGLAARRGGTMRASCLARSWAEGGPIVPLSRETCLYIASRLGISPLQIPPKWLEMSTHTAWALEVRRRPAAARGRHRGAGGVRGSDVRDADPRAVAG